MLADITRDNVAMLGFCRYTHCARRGFCCIFPYKFHSYYSPSQNLRNVLFTSTLQINVNSFAQSHLIQCVHICLVLIFACVHVCAFMLCNELSSYFFIDSLVHCKIDCWIITFQKGRGHLLCPIRMLMALKLILILVEILEGT